MSKNDLKAKLAEHKTAVTVAVITGCFGILIAAIQLMKKEPLPPPASASVQNVNVTNNVQNIQSQKPPANTVEDGSVVLEQFTINTADSLYMLCDSCETIYKWPRSSPSFWAVPTEMWEAVAAGLPNSEFVRQVAAENKGAQGDAFRKYISNPKYFQDRMNPVFDAVVSNHGHSVGVLTDIDVVVYRSEPTEQGDGEESVQSAIVPVLNRYVVELTDPRKLPFSIKQSATPPISIPVDRPARFQVEMVCKTVAAWSFEMQVHFQFGSGPELRTKKFRLSC